MSITIGPSSSWLRTKEVSDFFAVRCPVGTRLGDGSSIFCKANNRAWIVAPSCTQLTSQWAGGQYNSTLVGDKCCISEWTILCAQLLTCGFNPCDWFVPNLSQLQSGYNCRCNWDSFSTSGYWSSREGGTTCACALDFSTNTVRNWDYSCKGSFCNVVRAFRCVTY